MNFKNFKLHHLGYVIDDINDAVNHFKNFYNIENFSIYDFTPTRAWSYGKEVFDYKLKIAMSDTKPGDTGIEIIKPILGDGVHKEFIDSGKSGLHHICISVDKEYDDLYKKFYKDGFEFVFESETEDETIGYRRCFYAKDNRTGMIMEVKENPYFRK